MPVTVQQPLFRIVPGDNRSNPCLHNDPILLRMELRPTPIAILRARLKPKVVMDRVGPRRD